MTGGANDTSTVAQCGETLKLLQDIDNYKVKVGECVFEKTIFLVQGLLSGTVTTYQSEAAQVAH